ncbi:MULTISPECIES: methylmalonyl Co-A mutase-associated GTPase MeaB [Aequorivita]|uniref:Methylmalonyl Co-A mutase-associated GTPase MeaB n=1 Tax=Aequorivita iocasae TaxID=2803865 RepID=A0ABX7DSW5_9FLAO|nr:MULTISPECIES: methylmalonyl Co-A mutase-associated GTPase MeaB [Aequorivita]QQX76837.1 methylmalonyl Co-A mutase-associated GTPase MeaB [Aequorivita iocasae]UCA56309.1 methylmalonyl Co-A mutase-associated GTPase MeaB [Aequorivita sp. F7]
MAEKVKKISALKEKEGISQPETLNREVVKQLQSSKKKELSIDELVSGILDQNQATLSRAITIIESTAQKHQQQAKSIIDNCLPHANRSIRIGITGVPGVGKSTFIESFGKLLISEGKKVAVLTVDPSSSISKGSILGDKTRMEKLVKEKNAFIRPSASGDTLGGVARKTRETIILCEAAGFDVILIETVGVGQSETAVHSMTDFFLLLKLAGAGDELQGIKRGIMEMADSIVINKADGENLKAAKIAKNEFNRALHLYPAKESGWAPKTILCSALKNEGIAEIWEVVSDYFETVKSNGYFQHKRKEQNKFWLMQTIESRLKSEFYANPLVKVELEKQLLALDKNKTTPFEAAEKLLSMKN